MNKDALLTLHDVSAGYDGRVVVDSISLEVDRGTLLAIEGPNGSGKTTLLKVILGQLAPMRGHVIRARGISVGYMPQLSNADLEFPISVRDVILMGMRQRRLFGPDAAARAKVEELIKFARLEAVADSNIGEISGGQRQRAMLCRALMCDPDLLVLDEPVTYMDRRSETTLYALLPQLKGRVGVVLVTHDDMAAKRIATRVLCLGGECKDLHVADHPEHKCCHSSEIVINPLRK